MTEKMTPERIILGLLGDGLGMTRFEVEFHTGWDKQKVHMVMDSMVKAGLIKTLKRNIFMKL